MYFRHWQFLVDYVRNVRHHRKQMVDFGIWDESGTVRVHFLDESQVKHSQAVVDRDGRLVYLKNPDEKRPETLPSDVGKTFEPPLSSNPNHQPPWGPPPFYPWDMRDIEFS